MPRFAAIPPNLAERRGQLDTNWTASQLKAENRDFLAGLSPLLFRYRRGRPVVCACSAQPVSTNISWPDIECLSRPWSEFDLLAEADTFCFVAAPIVPYVRRLNHGSIRVRVQKNLAGAANLKSNLASRRASARSNRFAALHSMAGSVGEPTSHAAPRATYITVDEDHDAVEIPWK